MAGLGFVAALQCEAELLDEVKLQCKVEKFEHKVLAININRTYGKESIYNATRASWSLSYSSANNVDLIFAEYHNIVREIYVPSPEYANTDNKWNWISHKTEKGNLRWEFDGIVCENADINEQYLNKSLPERGKGNQNPIRYFNFAPKEIVANVFETLGWEMYDNNNLTDEQKKEKYKAIRYLLNKYGLINYDALFSFRQKQKAILFIETLSLYENKLEDTLENKKGIILETLEAMDYDIIMDKYKIALKIDGFYINQYKDKYDKHQRKVIKNKKK